MPQLVARGVPASEIEESATASRPPPEDAEGVTESKSASPDDDDAPSGVVNALQQRAGRAPRSQDIEQGERSAEHAATTLQRRHEEVTGVTVFLRKLLHPRSSGPSSPSPVRLRASTNHRRYHCTYLTRPTRSAPPGAFTCPAG